MEFTTALVLLWLKALDVETLFIEPGSPLENGYVESFNGKLRDELLDREIFYTLTEAKVLIERLGLIRFGGHLPKGEYDVDHDGDAGQADAAELHG